MSYRYLTIEAAIETHRLTVEKSGGGTLGVLEIDKLDSVLEHIQNDVYYPTFEDKLKKEEEMKRRIGARMELARFLQVGGWASACMVVVAVVVVVEIERM